MEYRNIEDIRITLKDAGCNDKQIDVFLKEFNRGNHTCVELLKNHRKELLDQMHRIQKQMYCLDFFLYKLDKNQVNIDKKLE